jgi:integrase
LKPYLQKAPATYNNLISALTAFVARYLQKPELMNGFKRSHVPDNYETNLPCKQKLKKAFETLENDCERAIFLMFATSGLRLSELWNLKRDDVDFETRCIKS